jgi:hypothetical protein
MGKNLIFQINSFINDKNDEVYFQIPLSCTQDEWDEWEENDVNTLGFIPTMESEYSVHDFAGYQNNESIFIGYATPDILEEKIPELLAKWKDKLIELGWVRKEQNFKTVPVD